MTTAQHDQWEVLYNKASAERDRLREVNAELLAAARSALVYNGMFLAAQSPDSSAYGVCHALRAAIARAEQETPPKGETP